MSKSVSEGLVYNTLGEPNTLLAAVLATGVGTALPSSVISRHIFQAFLSNTTTPTGTVDVEGSLDNIHWVVLDTMALTGADDTDFFVTDADWAYIRGNVTAIAGTDAALTLLVRN